MTRWWDAEWERTRLGTKYGWTKADAVALAKCASLAGSSQEEVCRRITALLDTEDAWQAQHATPRLLLAQWNTLAVKVRKLSHLEQYLFDLSQNGTAAKAANGEAR